MGHFQGRRCDVSRSSLPFAVIFETDLFYFAIYLICLFSRTNLYFFFSNYVYVYIHMDDILIIEIISNYI